MRWLLAAVLVAAAAWSALWIAGSRTLDRALRDALAAAAPDLVVDSATVAGFPNRFDVTLTEPRATDADGGITWSAPALRLYALSYKPWHTIASLPGPQRFTWPEGALTLSSDKLQASLVLRPTTALPLDRLTVVGDGLVLAPNDAPPTRIASVHFATRPDPTRTNTHEIGLEVAGIAPDPAVLALLPPGTGLPPEADTLRLTAFVGFSAPLDRFAAETRPAITRIDLHELSFRWGDIVLAGSGTLTPDAAGFAEGRIALRLDQWRKAIDAAVALGALRPEIAPTWAEFARRMSEAGGTPDRLDLPLTFASGRTSLGPIPLGPAPLIGP